MPTLKLGSKGDAVLQWQIFLAEQGQATDPGPLDSIFGNASRTATVTFQVQHGLSVNGQVDNATVAKAQQLGFGTVLDPNRQTGPNWPPKTDPPIFNAPKISTDVTNHPNIATHSLLGVLPFAPIPSDPQNITILQNWEQQNITTVTIPQLLGVAGANNGHQRFNRLIAKQFVDLWTAWEQAGLLPLVLSFNGGFFPRFQVDTTPPKSKISNHAFGAAFDINAAMNPLKAVPALISQRGSVRELVPIAKAHGFFWGGHFSTRFDGMHFEVAELH